MARCDHRRLCRVKNMFAMYFRYIASIFLTLHKRLWCDQVNGHVHCFVFMIFFKFYFRLVYYCLELRQISSLPWQSFFVIFIISWATRLMIMYRLQVQKNVAGVCLKTWNITLFKKKICTPISFLRHIFLYFVFKKICTL